MFYTIDALLLQPWVVHFLKVTHAKKVTMWFEMAKNIVFDFDGVLVDSKRMYVELIKKALEENGLKVSFREINEKLVPSIKGTVEKVIPGHMSSRETVIEKIERRVIEFTSTEGLGYVSLCDGVVSTLKDLKEKDNRMFLLSNSHSAFISKVLSFFNLNPYFDEVITLDSGFPSKDDALKHLSKMENVRLADIVYIGDTENDVRLARKAGCKIIIIFNEISWDFPNKQKISDLKPDFMIDKLCDLLPLIRKI
ncbi:MAG: HAD family hydrolase [Thermoplasmatales archaeon]|nr:HAD family hydrolase [Thermoplasmatales archaeon]